MPKKFVGENSKAVAARVRKESVKLAEANKQKVAQEDARWRDGDKKIAKKLQKKDELEKKRLDLIQKKADTKALLEKEMCSIGKISKLPVKITRAQIDEKIKPCTPPKKEKTHLELPFEENVNRSVIEGEIAHTVIEAINVLGKGKPADKHPEKRMKAVYTAFAERRLSEMKASNSTLRLSQLKQMIFKEWQKSPENPFNQI